jgi:16S rRNA (adenine1518-N6/adenine1519-N6)-dimethyltransferase
MKKPFAKKSFGQNFLIDQNYIKKIINALNLQKDDTIIEIGAGRGALTEKLIESGANVIAIELDKDLIPSLIDKFAEYENFQLVEQDALQVNFGNLILNNHKSQIVNRKAAKLVANLPYNISTAILQRLIEQRESFSEMILMFQREVVERITAEVGSKERGFLTVLVQAYLHTQKLFDVPPNAFRPVPKVWSSIVRLITKNVDEIEITNEKLFREIVSLGFMQKRKTIQNNLKNAKPDLSEKIEKVGGLNIMLEQANIAPNRRAETFTFDEWKKITNLVGEKG